MTFNKKIKTMAATAALLAGVGGIATVATAQTPVLVSLTQSAAITVVDIRDMAFGTWFLVWRNSDNFELRLTTAGVITPQNIANGAGNSVAINLVAAPTPTAQVSASLPTGANGVVVQMQRTAITQFVDPALILQATTYSTATEGANVAMPATTNVPVTIVTGGTAEVINFGADIAVTGMPTNGVKGASFDVSFSF